MPPTAVLPFRDGFLLRRNSLCSLGTSHGLGRRIRVAQNSGIYIQSDVVYSVHFRLRSPLVGFTLEQESEEDEVKMGEWNDEASAREMWEITRRR